MKAFLCTTALLAGSLLAGEITLTGATAQIQNSKGGYKIKSDRNLLRDWQSADSMPTWKLKASKAGSVSISIKQSNHKMAGTECVVSFGGDAHSITSKDTGSWKNFEEIEVGIFHFKEGSNTLKIDPIKLTGLAVMDLHSVTLNGNTELLTEIKPRNLKRTGVLTKLRSAHPSMKVTDLTPEGLNLKVSGIDFLSNGTMVVSSWDSRGSIYLINDYTGPREKMKIRRFAEGIAEPLGVCVVDDVIYVQQKQELTRLRDLDNDGVCDSYEVVCNAWDVSGNFHEFSFCPIYKDGYFYATLAVAVNKGGATTTPQVKDRGTLIKIDPKTGQYEVLAAGFRTPNGLALSADGERFYVADNQGDYLPANKILQVQKGRFYNHRYNPPHPMSELPVSPPLVWLPQNEIGNSPTQPLELTSGPYAGQLIFGDIHHGGLKRVSIEEVNGELQGTAFRFAQNIRGGTNRLAIGPKGDLYVGICGYRGNWGNGKRDGLLRVDLSEKPVFEIHSAKTMSNGLELTFTKPLAENVGWDPAYYQIDSYTYKPTIKYGGPKIDRHELTVASATVSDDRKRIFLEIPNIKPGYVVHGAFFDEIISANGDQAWAAEWWTTVNQLPTNSSGKIQAAPRAAKMVHTFGEEELSPHADALTVFTENCQSCHKTSNEKLVGPGLAGLIGTKQTVIRDGKKVEITIDKDYLRRAILDPGKEYPVGYQPIMPAIVDNLNKKQIDALIEWISTL